MAVTSGSYYDHMGNDLPRVWTGPDRPIAFAAVEFCDVCKTHLITINLSYPHAIRWDNRRKSDYPGAKGGWSLYTGMEQITYRIEEEPA